MLKVVFCRDGQAVSDFDACDFADATIRQYRCNRKDMQVRVANQLTQDAFVLRVLEEKLSQDEIEFYWEDIKLEFNREFGLIAPDGVNSDNICLFAKMTEDIVKLGYANMKARQLAEKNGQTND
jgi:hypothetical protein